MVVHLGISNGNHNRNLSGGAPSYTPAAPPPCAVLNMRRLVYPALSARYGSSGTAGSSTAQTGFASPAYPLRHPPLSGYRSPAQSRPQSFQIQNRDQVLAALSDSGGNLCAPETVLSGFWMSRHEIRLIPTMWTRKAMCIY